MRTPWSRLLHLYGTWIALCSFVVAQEATGPPEAIHYRDIGKRFYIEGEFGKLYTDFKIRGVVLSPIGKGDTSGKVRLEITHVHDKKLDKPRYDYVVTDSKFEVGSELHLVVREEGRLWYPEGIDAIGSAPDRTHLHKLHCVVSLHLRKILGGADSIERADPRQESNSEQGAAGQPASPPGVGD